MSRPDKIEITEEMIAAAADVLVRDPFAGDYVIAAEALAEEVIRAALSVPPRGSCRVSGEAPRRHSDAGSIS